MHRHVLLAAAGPAAARLLVVAQQLGEAAYVAEVVGVRRTDRPASRQPLEPLDQLPRVGVEPALLGDHSPPSCRVPD